MIIQYLIFILLLWNKIAYIEHYSALIRKNVDTEADEFNTELNDRPTNNVFRYGNFLLDFDCYHNFL